MKKIRTLAVALVICLLIPVSLSANQPPRFTDNFTGDGFTVDFIVNSNWYNQGDVGYNAQVLLTNTGNAPITGWILTSSAYLGLGANFQNGARVISQDDNHTTLEALNWNNTIAPGASVSVWLYSHSTNAPQGMTWELTAETAEEPIVPDEDGNEDAEKENEEDKEDKEEDEEDVLVESYDLPVIARFRNPNTGNVLSQLDPWFRITANRDVDLANLTIRYFYSINGQMPQEYVIDWASIDASLITGRFEYMGDGHYMADYFFEIGFTGGQLREGQTAYINARIFKEDHSHFIQEYNFSFAGADALATHIYWDRIAVFYEDILIWGAEPGEAAPGEEPESPDDEYEEEYAPEENDTPEDSPEEDAPEIPIEAAELLARPDTLRVRINGVFVYIAEDDQQPVVVDGRTLVPLRAVMEAMGFVVNWDRSTQTATLTMPGQIVIVQIGSYDMIVGGEVVPLQVPAQVIGGRTMLPLRAIGEAVGMNVDWDRHNQIADIAG